MRGQATTTFKNVDVDAGNMIVKANNDVAGVETLYRNVDLSGATSGSVVLYLYQNNLNTADQIKLQACTSTGTNCQELGNIGTTTGKKTFSLDAALAAIAVGRIQFVQPLANVDQDERISLSSFEVRAGLVSGYRGTTLLCASPTLVSDGNQIRVSLVLTSTEAVTDVLASTPITVVNVTNGAAVLSCSNPPTLDTTVGDGNNDIADANDAVGFIYTCTADTDSITTLSASLAFQASATGTGASGSVQFAVATSNSVLFAPPLTFQVQVDSPATVDAVVNTAYIKDAGVLPLTPSSPVETALSASIGDFVFVDFNGDGVINGADAGISGVVVRVTDGTNVYTATTDSSGAYLASSGRPRGALHGDVGPGQPGRQLSRLSAHLWGGF